MPQSVISVIIPVFNRPAKALRAIASVKSQSLPDNVRLEVILVDDYSTPPLTVPVSLAAKVIRMDQNSGAAAARNAGIEASSGNLIAFLDSDDVWLPEKLQSQARLFTTYAQENPSRLAVASGFYIPASSRQGRLQARIPRAAGDTLDFASGCWFSPGSTLFIHRVAFDVVGPFDARLRRLEDLDWFLRFARLGGRLHVANAPLAIIAPSGSARPEHVETSARVIEEKFQPRIGPLAIGDKEWRHLKAYLALERAAALLAHRPFLKALPFLLQSFLLKPRLQSALAENWVRSDDVPEAVTAQYALMT